VPISGKEMLRLYLAAGWIELRRKGSHVILRRGKKTQTIPIHGNTDLKKGLERKLLKELEE
jgi:predicted RNA binding protein YcfA (HicA-like mRNA interferase family)